MKIVFLHFLFGQSVHLRTSGFRRRLRYKLRAGAALVPSCGVLNSRVTSISMRLTSERLERLKISIGRALAVEWPQLKRTRERVARLEAVPIRYSEAAVPVVGMVATDGGENRLNLDPLRLQVFRVVDSTGQVYFEDFVPLSLEPEQILQFYFKCEPRIRKFLDWLGCSWEAVLPKTNFQRANLVSMLRELLEWAALLKLASAGPPKVIVRDGLLRTVVLSEVVVDALRRKLEQLTERHGHLLVGVAKRSKVINYLTLALGLNETFASGTPAYLMVPKTIEREAAPEQYRWIGERAMGQLYIARLDVGHSIPLFPVDIAWWQQDRAPEIMSLLAQSAHGSFPLCGYPSALALAHEHARLGVMEIQILEQLLLAVISSRDEAMARQVRLLRLMGRHLVEDESNGKHI